jgi:hypothetical protein
MQTIKNASKIIFVLFFLTISLLIYWFSQESGVLEKSKIMTAKIVFEKNSNLLNSIIIRHYDLCRNIPSNSSFFFNSSVKSSLDQKSCTKPDLMVEKEKFVKDFYSNLLWTQVLKTSRNVIEYKIKTYGLDNKVGGQGLNQDLEKTFYIYKNED